MHFHTNSLELFKLSKETNLCFQPELSVSLVRFKCRSQLQLFPHIRTPITITVEHKIIAKDSNIPYKIKRKLMYISKSVGTRM